MNASRFVRSTANVAIVCGLLILCAMALSWDWFLVQVMLLVHMNDFGKFYYSTQAFLAGQDMYAPNAATSLGYGAQVQFLNMNPPHFHLLLLPLARLPPAVALISWFAANVFAFVFALILIGRELEMVATVKRVLVIVVAGLVLAPSQTFVLTGQLSFLLMLPLTLAWLDARHERWGRAGAWLGACLSVKPFLLIFVPYFVITRRTRALITSLRTTVLCFVVGVLIFGLENYRAWFRAMMVSSDWAWASMNSSVFAVFLRMFGTTPYFTAVWFKPALVPLWMAVAALMGITTLVVVFNDRSRVAVDRAFALLLVAAQLISPLGWVYYLWLPAGPIAIVMADRQRRGQRQRIADRVLVGIVIVGLLLPPTALLIFQPSAWATVIVASAYFWATLSLWAWLMLDCVQRAPTSNV